jgi:hypothetical protein
MPMGRAEGIVQDAGGLVARAALSFIGLFTGLAIITATIATPTEPSASSSCQPVGPSQAAMTVVMRVPEGQRAKHLTMVDGSGRGVAILTLWTSGAITVVSRREGGAGVTCHLNDDGSASLRIEGTARAALIRAGPDGTTELTERSQAHAFGESPDSDRGRVNASLPGPSRSCGPWSIDNSSRISSGLTPEAIR